MYTDSHAHPYDLFRKTGLMPALADDQCVCASAHDRDEFLWHEAFARLNPGRVRLSFGIHPQKPEAVEIPFLEELARTGRIDAVGECGFDFFSDAYRSTAREQAAVWDLQLDLALRFSLPLVIHARKALHLVFADTKRLSRLPAVAFHGWPGSASEAESLLKRGIDARFCAGKALLRGDKSLLETVRALPADRLLSETDAPYMQDRTEPYSVFADIRRVVAALSRAKNMQEAEMTEVLYRSFTAVFAAYRGQRQAP